MHTSQSDTADRASNDAAVIEIVEHSRSKPGPGAAGIIRVNQVRINGQALWVPEGKPIRVHEMVFNDSDGDDDIVQVTLTLFARRVFIGHENESPEQGE